MSNHSLAPAGDRVRPFVVIAKIVLWGVASTLWCVVIVAIGGSVHLPFGHPLVFLVLCGITVAVHRLLRRVKHGWAIAATLAPLLIIAGLALVAILAGEIGP